jgi:hypothetical protein
MQIAGQGHPEYFSLDAMANQFWIQSNPAQALADNTEAPVRSLPKAMAGGISVALSLQQFSEAHE